MYRRDDTEMLFRGESLSTRTDQATEALRREVKEWPADDLLGRPVAEIVEHLVANHSLNAPVLDADAAAILDEDQHVEHTLSGRNAWEFGNGPVNVTFRRITLAVPFTGEAEMFRLRPGASNLNPPRGRLAGNSLQLDWENPVAEQPDPQRVRTELLKELENVKWYLTAVTAGVAGHNTQLRTLAATLVNERRTKLTADRGLRGSLGFPVRRRADADRYAVPVRRKHLTTSVRSAGIPAAPAAPYLPDEDYEQVLRVLAHQRTALERTPSLAEDMDEEKIRDFLLIGLNAQFEGRAAGEVFNRVGKTDILVREQDKNIFIGECKFWRGPKTIDTTLDQLLGYLAWRDTKAALLLFIRTGTPSEVIDKALARLKEHPQYAATGPGDIAGERYNFVFCSPTDPQQRVRLAFLPFVLV